jgi:hypothetical protein
LIEIVSEHDSPPADKAKWRVTNYTGSDIYVMGFYIDWPVAHTLLDELKLDSPKIWSEDDTEPPTSHTWSVTHKNRKLKPSEDKRLEFRFDDKAPSQSYTLQVTFDNGCVITPSS